MIANCPTCGTHYKHEAPEIRVRARCGQCDTTLDLARLRPYRVAPVGEPSVESVERARRHSSIGLDDPALATTIAQNVLRPAPAPSPERAFDKWEDQDPLPPIPEMTLRGPFEPGESDGADDAYVFGTVGIHAEEGGVEHAAAEAPPPASGRATSLALWVAAGAIAATGASWTMGGSTVPGLSAGAALGAAAGWAWLRWMSPR